MCQNCVAAVSNVWAGLAVGAAYHTPDVQRQVHFHLVAVNANGIEIGPQDITITRAAFDAAVNYLCQHGHRGPVNPCLIGARNSPVQAGPLCMAARVVNVPGQRRCINYILPILAVSGVVGINGQRPNQTWLI